MKSVRKAAELTLLCLTPAVAKDGQMWGAVLRLPGKGIPSLLVLGGLSHSLVQSLAIMPCMHRLLFLLVSSGLSGSDASSFSFYIFQISPALVQNSETP